MNRFRLINPTLADRQVLLVVGQQQIQLSSERCVELSWLKRSALEHSVGSGTETTGRQIDWNGTQTKAHHHQIQLRADVLIVIPLRIAEIRSEEPSIHLFDVQRVERCRELSSFLCDRDETRRVSPAQRLPDVIAACKVAGFDLVIVAPSPTQ